MRHGEHGPGPGVVDVIHHHWVHGSVRVHVDMAYVDVVGAGKGLGHTKAEL